MQELTHVHAELHGGPADGQSIRVEWPPPESLLVQLDPEENGGQKRVVSYEFAARTTACGKRWVYEYDRFIGVRGVPEKGATK